MAGQRSAVATTPGGMPRTAVLAGLVLALAASSFDNTAIASSAYAARYVLAALLIWLTITRSRERDQRSRGVPGPARLLLGASWAMAVLAAASSLWSVAPGETLLQTAVFVLLVWNMHVHVVYRWHNHEDLVADIRTIFWVLAATVIVSLTGGALVGGRLAGVYDNPNSLGILAVLTASLGIGLLFEQASIALLVATTVAVATVWGTGSRTAIFGFVAALIIMAPRRKALPPFAAILFCFGSAGLLLLYFLNFAVPFPATVERFERYGSIGFLDDRQIVWEFGIRVWELEPLHGHGFRTVEIIFMQERSMSGGSTIGASFNSYLQILIELGYLGLVPLLGMVLAALWAVLRSRFIGLQAGLSVLVCTGLASGITESALFGLGSAIAWTFWLGVAALTATAQSSRGKRDEVEGSPAKTETPHLLRRPSA